MEHVLYRASCPSNLLRVQDVAVRLDSNNQEGEGVRLTD
jgi:hypothetical protein